MNRVRQFQIPNDLKLLQCRFGRAPLRHHLPTVTVLTTSRSGHFTFDKQAADVISRTEGFVMGQQGADSNYNMRIGIAADHGGFELKEKLSTRLHDSGHEVTDFGGRELNPDDDYPDFAVPLAGC